MKLNWNSLILGILLGVCLALAIGAGTPSPGRYQISGSGNVAWVVDTETGQVWVTEKRAVEPSSSMVYTEKPTWHSYGLPSQATL